MDTITQILIIEDEFIIAKDIQLALENVGYTVTIAKSSEKAIAEFAHKDFDCIISDINLNEDIDGIDLIQTLLNVKYTPVIFLTAYDNESFLERAKETVPFAYLLKPFDEKQLLLTIDLAVLNFTKMKGEYATLSEPQTIEEKLEALTKREREILISLSTGKTSKEIGKLHHISHLTVEKHKKNIKKKLHMKTVGELVSFVFQSNLYSI